MSHVQIWIFVATIFVAYLRNKLDICDVKITIHGLGFAMDKCKSLAVYSYLSRYYNICKRDMQRIPLFHDLTLNNGW